MKVQDILKDGISFTRTFTDENGSWFVEFKADEVKQLLQVMEKQNLERIQINKKKKRK